MNAIAKSDDFRKAYAQPDFVTHGTISDILKSSDVRRLRDMKTIQVVRCSAIARISSGSCAIS